MNREQNKLSLKTLTKSRAWDVQENDVVRMLKAATKDADVKENFRHYIDILRSAFEMEEQKNYKPEDKVKLEKRGFTVTQVDLDENNKYTWAIKKKSISRVTDLSYENIRHISARQLLEVIDRNFGGGWDSLSQSIRDIIESGFDISTSTLPKANCHSGMYKRKVADGFEVLEIAKGNWVESIFAKAKPLMEKPRLTVDKGRDPESDDYDEPDGKDEEDEFNEDELSEDNYSTRIEEIELDSDEDLAAGIEDE